MVSLNGLPESDLDAVSAFMWSRGSLDKNGDVFVFDSLAARDSASSALKSFCSSEGFTVEAEECSGSDTGECVDDDFAHKFPHLRVYYSG